MCSECVFHGSALVSVCVCAHRGDAIVLHVQQLHLHMDPGVASVLFCMCEGFGLSDCGERPPQCLSSLPPPSVWIYGGATVPRRNKLLMKPKSDLNLSPWQSIAYFYTTLVFTWTLNSLPVSVGFGAGSASRGSDRVGGRSGEEGESSRLVSGIEPVVIF